MLAYEHLWQETFAAGAVFRSSALCLSDYNIAWDGGSGVSKAGREKR